MKILKIILKEPLTQFLIFGGILFFIYQKTASVFNPTELVINKDNLIEYMQYQANGFNKTTFEQKYAALSQEEKQKILEEYTSEEVLVREAKPQTLSHEQTVAKKETPKERVYFYGGNSFVLVGENLLFTGIKNQIYSEK